MSDTKAKRGDLAVRVATTVTHEINPSRRIERCQVTLGRVTSITRDGIVKAVAEPAYAGDDGAYPWRRDRDYQGSRLYVLGADRVDVGAVLASYAERRWPSARPDSTMVYPFQSLDEAREHVRQYVTS